MNETPSSNGDGAAPPAGPERAGGAEPVERAQQHKPQQPRQERRTREQSGPPNEPAPPGSPDDPKPNPRREPARSDVPPRPLVIDGTEWVAYPSGKGAYGTGQWGLAGVEAVHFAKADAPEKPLLEALLASGRFSDLYDEELIALFRTARTIVIPEPGSVPAPRRFSLEEGRS